MRTHDSRHRGRHSRLRDIQHVRHPGLYYPRLRRKTSTIVETITITSAAPAAATAFLFFASPLLPASPLLAPWPGKSLKKAAAPLAAAAVAAAAPPAVPKLTSLLVRDIMLREAKDVDRLGVRGPSSTNPRKARHKHGGRARQRHENMFLR